MGEAVKNLVGRRLGLVDFEDVGARVLEGIGTGFAVGIDEVEDDVGILFTLVYPSRRQGTTVLYPFTVSTCPAIFGGHA